MKKDITNVVVTFGLIGLMLYGGSFFYTKKLLAEEASWNVDSTTETDLLSEQSKIQEEILANQVEEARLLAEKDLSAPENTREEVLIDTTPPKPEVTKPTTNTTFANEIAKKQAEYQAAQQAILDAQQAELNKKQIAADALEQKIADQKAADARAQKLADQKAAAEKVAAGRASRRSRAS